MIYLKFTPSALQITKSAHSRSTIEINYFSHAIVGYIPFRVLSPLNRKKVASTPVSLESNTSKILQFCF